MRARFMLPLKKLCRSAKRTGPLVLAVTLLIAMVDQEFPTELQRVVALLNGNGIGELVDRVRPDCLRPAAPSGQW